MKKNLVSKNFGRISFVTLMVVSALMVFGGQSAYAEAIVATDNNSGVQCKILFADHTIDAGRVCAEVVGDNLEITFSTSGAWKLEEAHLWIGGNLGDIPQTRQGNPKIGNFPYKSGDITGATNHTFQVPLNNLGIYSDVNKGNSDFYVAAHAALRKIDSIGNVIQTESGWAER